MLAVSSPGRRCVALLLAVSAVSGQEVEVNPQCYKSFDVFLSESASAAVNRARRELGLPAKKKLTFTTHEIFKYKPSTGCFILAGPTTCYEYRTVLKGGNDAIRASVELWVKQANNSSYVFDVNSCRNENERAEELCPGKNIVSFSFVREPVSHFVSGYGEYVYRTYLKHDIVVPDYDLPEVFVQNQFNIEERHLNWKNLRHVSLMSTVLRPFREPRRNGGMQNSPLTHIGHLSRAGDDWVNIFHPLDKFDPPLLLSKTVGQHVSSNDPHGLKTRLNHVLATNHSLRRALCYFLERDYFCFNYDFEACLDGTALQSPLR